MAVRREMGAPPLPATWRSSGAGGQGRDVGTGRKGAIPDTALGPGGALVAVGWTTATPAHAAAFTSPEGLRWTPVPDGPTLAGAAMRGLACDERHCLAGGQAAGASAPR